jgi:hypothetical protein
MYVQELSKKFKEIDRQTRQIKLSEIITQVEVDGVDMTDHYAETNKQICKLKTPCNSQPSTKGLKK